MTLAIQTREVVYQDKDGHQLIGYFAAPENAQAVAGVLVSPEWWGRNEYTEQRARELAEHGYAAIAIDMYGDKKVTTDASQAYAWMMDTFKQENTIVVRATAALETLATQPEVDVNRLAAIGFCYGGKVILDLARSGAPLKAVATFHANLSAQSPAEKGKVQAEVTHRVTILKDAKHGFSNPLADERAKANDVDLGYNATAEKQSLQEMYALLQRKLA